MKPYGSWKSPVTSVLAANTKELGEIALDGSRLYWRELRSKEYGRYTLMCRDSDGYLTELVSEPFNVRTLVHEYGGGSFIVANDTVYFSNFADQRVYRKKRDELPVSITSDAAMRYADGTIDRKYRRLITIREDHTVAPAQPVNTIVSIDTEDDEGVEVLVSGNDFYSSPRISPDGSLLAWVTWNYPNMPWDSTELWVGEFDGSGSIGESERIAGGIEESILQPEWSPDGVLYFVSDRSGWWNIYRWYERRVEPICEMSAEFARPSWTFSLNCFAFESARRIVCAYTSGGEWQLAEIDVVNRKMRTIGVPYSEVSYVRAAEGRAVFVAGAPTMCRSIEELDLGTKEVRLIYPASDSAIESGYISTPQHCEFPTSNNLMAYGYFYAPKNPDFYAPTGELPPLIVAAHGGPTNSTQTTLDLTIQYWTSRGFAYLDVNYGGSTGYGRSYRERLYGNWGVVDVDDCVNGALYLVRCGDADASRILIRGRSAGGYTTLSALAFKSLFRAGASYYGISDLEAFDKNTHKFESRYTRKLVGPFPEKRELYQKRSPTHILKRVSGPILLLQGLEDKVVPPEQAELMMKALHEKRLPFAYLPFQNEQHGFRCKENIKRALEAELYFYSLILHLRSPDSLQPIKIENFSSE